MKQQIIDLLKSTKREGIERLIDNMESNGFFESPASTKFHGCYTGGLAKHSMNVYKYLNKLVVRYKIEISPESVIIATLLHDLCKIGAYIGTEKPYSWNRGQPKGHATLSLKRIKEFIVLSELEEKMILYHMGIYGLAEFQNEGQAHKGEYTLRGNGMVNVWNHYPVVKLMYFCDELATIHEKTEEET